MLKKTEAKGKTKLITIIERPIIKDKIIEVDKYNVTEKPTIKYNVAEKPTVRYVVSELSTTKYKVREVECEKPVLKEKTYDVPAKGIVTTIREAVELIKQVIPIMPTLIERLKIVIACSEKMPEMVKEFKEMRKMIEGYEIPKFKERIVYNAIVKDIVVNNAIPKDVEVINAVVRDKVMDVEELIKKLRKVAK